MSLSLRSFNFPNRFMRHQDFRGKVSEIATELDRKDATFRIQNDADVGTIAVFRSVNFPSHVLRHQNFEVKRQEFNPGLSPPNAPPETPEQQLLRQDSSFKVVRGLADPNGVSFESVNFPGRYIRHRNFLLFLEPGVTELERADATFFKVAPLAPDGPGPN